MAENYRLSGFGELGYGFALREADKTTSQTTILDQVYNLNLDGKVWDPRFGLFSSGITYRDRRVGEETDSDTKVLGYNLALSLLRAFFPLTLFGRRETLDVGGDLTRSFTVTDTTYGANLLLPFRKFPSLSLNYQDLTSETDNPSVKIREIEERRLDVGLNKSFGRYNLSLSYNMRDVVRDFSGNSFRANQISAGLGARPFDTLFLNASGLFSERGEDTFLNAGFGLVYTPSPRWDTNLSYFFFKSDRVISAVEKPFQSQLQFLTYGLRFRPTQKLQTRIEYSFSEGENNDVRTSSNAIRVGQLIRFPLGFDTDLGYFYATTERRDFESTTQGFRGALSKKLTERLIASTQVGFSQRESSSRGNETESQTFDYGGGLKYLRPFKGFTMESSYGVGFKTIEEEAGADSGIGHTANLNVFSTAFEKTQISSGYQFVQETSSVGNSRLTHLYTLGVNASPSNNLILGANFDVNLSEDEDEDSTVERKSVGFSGNLSYLWSRKGSIQLFSGYAVNPIKVVERFTDLEESDVTKRLFYGGNLNFLLNRNLSLSIPVRQEINSRESGEETVFRAKPLLVYRLGQIFLVVEGRFSSVEQTNGRSFKEYGVIFRVRRSFSRLF